MRVALCLSGQTRTFENVFYTQFTHIIKKYKTDIFIHTWLYNGLYPKTPDNLHYCREYKIENHDRYLTNDYLNDKRLLELYIPKKCLLEYPEKNYFIGKIQSENKQFFNALMMHYSIYSCNELKKQYEIDNSFLYDIVIRCRFDLFFQRCDLVLKDYNTIYLPPHANVNNPFTDSMKRILEKDGPSYMPNDQFAYGSSSAMDYYSSLYKNYIKKQSMYPNHPEGMLSDHLWKFNKNYKIEINSNILMGIA